MMLRTFIVYESRYIKLLYGIEVVDCLRICSVLKRNKAIAKFHQVADPFFVVDSFERHIFATGAIYSIEVIASIGDKMKETVYSST